MRMARQPLSEHADGDRRRYSRTDLPADPALLTVCRSKRHHISDGADCAERQKIRCQWSHRFRRKDDLMRLVGITASVFALALAMPAFAQAPQSATGTSSAHSTTSSSGSPTAASSSVRQFKTETEAKSACGGQPVVWANTSSHVLHAAGSKYFGKTKRGAYVCENAAEQAGYHMANNGQ